MARGEMRRAHRETARPTEWESGVQVVAEEHVEYSLRSCVDGVSTLVRIELCCGSGTAL